MINNPADHSVDGSGLGLRAHHIGPSNLLNAPGALLQERLRNGFPQDFGYLRSAPRPVTVQYIPDLDRRARPQIVNGVINLPAIRKRTVAGQRLNKLTFPGPKVCHSVNPCGVCVNVCRSQPDKVSRNRVNFFRELEPDFQTFIQALEWILDFQRRKEIFLHFEPLVGPLDQSEQQSPACLEVKIHGLPAHPGFRRDLAHGDVCAPLRDQIPSAIQDFISGDTLRLFS